MGTTSLCLSCLGMFRPRLAAAISYDPSESFREAVMLNGGDGINVENVGLAKALLNILLVESDGWTL